MTIETPIESEAPAIEPQGSETPAPEAPSEAPASPAFPDNWVELMAGEDEKTKSLLSRYASPKDVSKALVNANQKLSEKSKINKPDGNASPEELQQWRDAWGIPQTPEDYKIELSEGREIAEHDKEFVDSFVKDMHANHATPELINNAINKYYEVRENEERQLEQINAQDKIEVEETLRAEYGPKYRDNINAATTFLDKTFGQEVSEVLKNAIGKDGRMLMNNPDIVKVFVNMGLQDNPRITMPSGFNSTESMAGRKAEIQQSMKDGSYYGNSSMQAEYRKILETEEKLGLLK